MTDPAASPPRLYLAPMKGLTDHVFRRVFAEHWSGLDAAVAPFISSRRDKKIKPAHVRDVLPENNRHLPVFPQILSNTAGDFVTLANYFHDLGHGIVNWNLGCPFPTVVRKSRGAGLLPDTDRIEAFLEAALPRLRGSLSIKTRLGWDSPEELQRLLPIFNRYSLAELIVHPRLGRQRYEGRVDLDAFARVAAETSCPVVYNGDIRTVNDFVVLSRRFPGVDRWMIGRGCLSAPFLPHLLKTGGDGDISNNLPKMKQFHDALLAAYSARLSGPAHVLNKMKGFWRYYGLSFLDCDQYLKKILKAPRPQQYTETVERFFASGPRLRPLAERNGF